MKIKKIETIEQEVNSNEVLDKESETTTEFVVMETSKPKWSWKKKLAVGGGIVLGLILGAVATVLGTKPTDSYATVDDDDDDFDDEIDNDEIGVESEKEDETEDN